MRTQPDPRTCRRHPLDAVTQAWMKATSQRMAAEAVPWLAGPCAGTPVVGHDWVARAAAEVGGRTSTGPEHGLLPDFGDLAGPAFDPEAVDPRIVDFYQRTSAWRLDLWSEWSPVAWPFGWAITALWSQRLQQLSLPMRPLDVSHGMDSSVVHVHDGDATVVGAAWLRTMRKTGATTYSGLYGTARLPGAEQPCVRVVFPLPMGRLPVFLRPTADRDGTLRLRSPIGPFGSEGAYLVLDRFDGTVNARRIPIAEEFHVYVDADGEVRTDHSLNLGRIPALRLHYRMRW